MPDGSYATAPYEEMGPAFLAAQPPELSRQSEPVGENWGEIFTKLESRYGGMRSWRYSWWAYWAQLAEYILPRRYHWLVVANKMNRGNPINQAIIDSTATLAMQICAAGLWTGLTSPSRPWFKIGLGVPWAKLDAEGKKWLEAVEERMYTVLGKSNFYTIMAQAMQDISTFGTAPVICYEDVEDLVRFYLPCAGEYYLDCGSRLSVDTLYREFTLNTVQIVEMFGLENCPVQVREAYATGGASWTLEFVVMHAIEPNNALAKRGAKDKGKIQVVPSSFPYREVYWLKGVKTEKELSRKGFYERPFAAARWSVVSNDAYGRSPGMDALGDIKQLQLETRRKAEFLEKIVRPPMGADPELKNEPSSILPGNITYVNSNTGKKGFWPLYEVNPQVLQPLVEDIKTVQERINRCFFVDVFMAITQMEGVQPRNELELTKRDLERLQVLGPFIELFETEFASPILQRVYGILSRKKLLPPMPQSLKGVPLKIEYISIMRLAQRSSEVVAIKDTLQTAGALSSAAKAAGVPDPLRILNLDEAMRVIAELNSYPSSAVYTKDEVEQHDQTKLHQQMAEQAQQQAMAGVTAAKTLAETPTGGQTALSALTGGAGPGGSPGG